MRGSRGTRGCCTSAASWRPLLSLLAAVSFALLAGCSERKHPEQTSGSPGGEVDDACTSGEPAADDATCDGFDDDCDGEMDEDYVPEDCDTGLDGACARGTTECTDGVLECIQNVEPTAHDPTCDGIDEDCDGQADEDYVGDPVSCGTGACLVETTSTCIDGEVDDTCTPGEPAADDASCNGVDDDCNGEVDEDYAPEASACGQGACAASGELTCVDGNLVDTCVAGTPAADDATCDGIDDDCDGTNDEDYASQATAIVIPDIRAA